MKTLNDWLRWQEDNHPQSIDLGLERVGEVWQRLGAPRLAQHTIIVAGTNGKGSCVRWAEEICRAHGVSVASFTSPHLLNYRERIRFNNEMVGEEALIVAFNLIDQLRGQISLTYFEWSALAGLHLIAKRYPEVAVIEVGLGGRLDATNLIDADMAILTRIGLDHQPWLGNTIEAIAREKAGVLREGQRVFFADGNPPRVLLERAEALHCEIYRRDPNDISYFPPPRFMHGQHQYGHLGAVCGALGFCFDLNSEALHQAIKVTKNEGRLMREVCHGQNFLFDVAHNEDSAAVLAEYLSTVPERHITAVCGILNDKDQQAIFRQLKPWVRRWLLVPLDSPRSTPPAQLRENALQAGIPSSAIQVRDSIAKALVERDELLLVTGSFVTVSAALQLLRPPLNE